MNLQTMEPNPAWDADSYPGVVGAFDSLGDDAVVKVWGGDWCGDCRAKLPDFAAALSAAGVANVEQYPVERENGEKVGPHVEEYDIERIPTIVVEDGSGGELARFVEEERFPPAQYLAEEIDAE
ncbi:thioredoxin family protein [Halobacterium zhouii]|uniref:thioredoxin family protein n=1 Tax=Halobacterium zhouii TaxID=2902624 RepID=UPI001E634F29|nr:thioredoxin family protein [Halobacterium zhouii]